MQLIVYAADLQTKHSNTKFEEVTFEMFQDFVKKTIKMVGSALFCRGDSAKVIFPPADLSPPPNPPTIDSLSPIRPLPELLDESTEPKRKTWEEEVDEEFKKMDEIDKRLGNNDPPPAEQTLVDKMVEGINVLKSNASPAG